MIIYKKTWYFSASKTIVMVQRCFSHLLRHVKSSVIFEGIFPEACTLTNAECFSLCAYSFFITLHCSSTTYAQ
jgi:hypothetical protein